MEDLVIITNRKGHKYEVTRERAEKMIKNGDIKYTDVCEMHVAEAPLVSNPVVSIAPEVVTVPSMSHDMVLTGISTTLTDGGGSINISDPVSFEDAGYQKNPVLEESGPTELQVLRAEYKEKIGKGVPVAKTKDVEWIKSQLSK